MQVISICESYESRHFCLRFLLLAEEITVISVADEGPTKPSQPLLLKKGGELLFLESVCQDCWTPTSVLPGRAKGMCTHPC